MSPVESRTGAGADSSLRARQIRRDFPILQTKVHGKPLVYLDNAATSQKPQCVLDSILDYYRQENANIHRGVHWLSQRATERFERAREVAQKFLGAERFEEVVFTSGATESINLVAQSFVKPRLKRGDEVLVSAMEHHSNIVPWQLVCEQAGARLRTIPMNDMGELEMEALPGLLTDKTRLVSVVHLSNALGTVNPVEEIIEAAHRRGIPVLIDGAQAAPHLPVDVRRLGCDFYCFSGHKIFGPTGIGVLYGRRKWLEEMPPYKGGGDMIRSVTFEKTTFSAPPSKFEAGTPNIAGAIGLGRALEYVSEIGLDWIAQYEAELLEYAESAVAALPGIQIIGRAKKKGSVVSFVVNGVHPHDVGTVLDQMGIAVRTGHHCAQPVMDFFGVPATTRASLAFYNTREDVDALVAGLKKVEEVLG
ncbi:MAG TPA: cysteine desulfurase [Acidobacteriota bacterium]|nr:cysteine desulfurase [Acidobacteriota bacterium]